MDTTASLNAALAGRYMIERELGRGGMATVFLARDLRHDRLVALKVLHPDLAAALGTERFLAEIKTTANLQHPHILPLHDSGEAREGNQGSGFLFYVMPFVAGETLRARLDREQLLPIDDALRIATQTLGALDYAHRQGVVHRDIKPENILMHDGSAVVADFGIALAVQTAGGQRMTQTGLSLGTPQYMSPEQATGERQIDGRADIYAMGAVLYEMLTGEAPFTGPTVQAIVAKVLTERPMPPTVTRDTIPAHVEAAILRALAKLPADRFATAAQFAEALTSGHNVATARAISPTTTASRAASPWPGRALWIVAAASLAIAATVGWRASRASSAPSQPIFAALLPPQGEEFAELESFGQLSPDGRQFVFATQTDRGSTRLWLRDMGAPKAQPINDTDGATAPFWSPDGKSIAYFKQNLLIRIQLPSGAPRVVCPARGGTSGVWTTRGEVIFGTVRGLELGSAEKGQCRVVVAADPKAAEQFRHPTPLPDGRHVLVTHRTFRPVLLETIAIDLETGQRRDVVKWGSEPTFVAPDHLFYGDYTQLRLAAVRFDPRTLTLGGQPVLTSDTMRSTFGVFSYSVSNAGLLVNLANRGVGSVEPTLLTNGSGEVIDTVRSRFAWTTRMARTKTMVALGSEASLSIYDPARNVETPIVRGWGTYPQWSPADTAIAVSNVNDCSIDVANLRTGKTQRLVQFEQRCPRLSEWSADGRYLVMSRLASDSVPTELWTHDLSTKQSSVLLSGDADYTEGALSPDGKWLAYVSNETGSPEVFIRRFGAPGGAERVSTASGRTPRWRNDGRTLVFITADGRILEVGVVTGDRIDVGTPRVKFRVNNWARTLFTDISIPFDMTPDANRFVVFGGSTNVAMLNQNVFRALSASGTRK